MVVMATIAPAHFYRQTDFLCRGQQFHRRSVRYHDRFNFSPIRFLQCSGRRHECVGQAGACVTTDIQSVVSAGRRSRGLRAGRGRPESLPDHLIDRQANVTASHQIHRVGGLARSRKTTHQHRRAQSLRHGARLIPRTRHPPWPAVHPLKPNPANLCGQSTSHQGRCSVRVRQVGGQTGGQTRQPREDRPGH